MDKVTDIVDYAKANPVAAGMVALASAGTVAVVWFRGRGSNAPSQSAMGVVGDSTQPGAIVQIKNEVLPTPAPMTPPKPSSSPPTNQRLAFQPATPPKGYDCPNTAKAVYGLRPGTFQQTDGNVVCQYPDGRIRPLHKIGASWTAWRKQKVK